MASVLERLQKALAPGITVERELARGAMGRVFLGHDTVLDRPVAIKVLKEDASAVDAARFLREARVAARLDHPNIVRVHRAGEADGLPYYVMDLAPQATHAERLTEEPMPPDEVVRLGLDVLAGLGAAHAAGLVHRDIKPANIFMEGDRALVGDFGVVRVLDSKETRLTRTGGTVGTPAYISPEQLHGTAVTARTDLYAVGLVLYEAATGTRWRPLTPPEKGDWSRVPRRLREPVRGALQLDPDDRWPDAEAFSRALSAAQVAGWRWRLPVALATVAVAVGLVGLREVISAPPACDLAVFPFGTAGLADSSMGPRLAGLTGWEFEELDGFALAPRQQTFRLWFGSSLPPARRLAALTEELGCRYGAGGVVRPRGERLEVQLAVVGARGAPVHEGIAAGDSAEPSALAESVAGDITRAVFSDRRYGRADALARVPAAAVTEFMQGEAAFANDAWLTAEKHYLRALELDSTFVLAGWRLGNARRWMPLRSAPPYPPGLYRLFLSDTLSLPAVDRRLIEAQFRPSGEQRFQRYEQALGSAGSDPYAALLYGDELFHRGPLAGRPLQDAVDMLQVAARADSTLAPAWEHLAWAQIRLGAREEAGRALARLERLVGRPEESEIYLPLFLRVAHDFRFGSPTGGAEAVAALARDPPALAIAARGAMTFDLPHAQLALGDALVATGRSLAHRASGSVARGIALVALGRPMAALQAFDSAARLFPSSGEATLQAAEWRVIPPALGVPGVPDSERERGRAVLRSLADGAAAGERAAWALALDAWARGDTAGAGEWTLRVGSFPGGERMLPLLRGFEAAARERWAAALAASEPALAYDSAGYAPDPFFRSALHLARGEWLARSGSRAEAERAWLWHENLDVIGWPGAEAQAAEVDWALGTYARARRALLALDGGLDADGCALGRRALELWVQAEPAVAAYGRGLTASERRCPS